MPGILLTPCIAVHRSSPHSIAATTWSGVLPSFLHTRLYYRLATLWSDRFSTSRSRIRGQPFTYPTLYKIHHVRHDLTRSLSLNPSRLYKVRTLTDTTLLNISLRKGAARHSSDRVACFCTPPADRPTALLICVSCPHLCASPCQSPGSAEVSVLFGASITSQSDRGRSHIDGISYAFLSSLASF